MNSLLLSSWRLARDFPCGALLPAKKAKQLWGVLLLLLAVWTTGCSATEFAPSASSGQMILWPSAHDQISRHVLRVGTDVLNTNEASFQLDSLHYGLQLGGLQIATDSRYTNDPRHDFDYQEARLKLRLFESHQQRFAMALGALGRFTESSSQRERRIDSRTSSLLGVFTMELYPFVQGGGIRTNFYLDNRVSSLGLEFQINDTFKLVAEGEYFHARKHRLERAYEEERLEAIRLGRTEPQKPEIDYTNHRSGLEISNSAYYIQLLTGDELGGFVIQMGISF